MEKMAGARSVERGREHPCLLWDYFQSLLIYHLENNDSTPASQGWCEMKYCVNRTHECEVFRTVPVNSKCY